LTTPSKNSSAPVGGQAQPHVTLGHDKLLIRRWFLFYAALLGAGVLLLLLMFDRSPGEWNDWALVWHRFCGLFHGGSAHCTWRELSASFQDTFSKTDTGIKLLVAVLYLSFCTTLTPLPANWIVAGMATQSAAIAGDAWSVALLVGLAGAVGSTIANLNDYYIWTWLLRSRRVAKVRNARWYAAAARWFSRSPFLILTIFNIIPIPVDVIRLLAITYRYDRLKFTAANFLGRFIRYAVMAFVTYQFRLGWIAPVSLLALAAFLGIVKVLHTGWRRFRTSSAVQ
jgi:membrane protein YqaA with SNARE-associated domain